MPHFRVNLLTKCDILFFEILLSKLISKIWFATFDKLWRQFVGATDWFSCVYFHSFWLLVSSIVPSSWGFQAHCFTIFDQIGRKFVGARIDFHIFIFFDLTIWFLNIALQIRFTSPLCYNIWPNSTSNRESMHLFSCLYFFCVFCLPILPCSWDLLGAFLYNIWRNLTSNLM